MSPNLCLVKMMHQKLADSTVMIFCGNSRGSGFVFKKEKIIVTNRHVINNHFINNDNILVATENSLKKDIGVNAQLISQSEQYDFAVLELLGDLPSESPTPLLPAQNTEVLRGRKVLFAGFPHGITDLLVHEAIVSGPLEQHAFYIDGMVNGGNSGGPIVDAHSGELVGIVTQRRFLGESEAKVLAQKSHQIASRLMPSSSINAIIMGINFGQFAANVSQAISVLPEIISLNSNSGIGIGFKIDFVDKVI